MRKWDWEEFKKKKGNKSHLNAGSTSVSNWGSIPLKIPWGIYRMVLGLSLGKTGDLGILSADSQPSLDELSLRAFNSWASFPAGWVSSCSSRENPQAKVEEGETQRCLGWKAAYMGTIHWRSGDPSSRPRGYGALTVSAAQYWRGAPYFTLLIQNAHILSLILQISNIDIFKYFTVYTPNDHHQQ